MSFMSDYRTALKKLKKEEDEQTVAPSSYNGSSDSWNSFMSDYRKELNRLQEENVEDIKTKSSVQFSGKATKRGEDDESLLDLFQMGALDDGINAKNIGKAILGTVGDVAYHTLLKAPAQMGEGIGDWLSLRMADFAEEAGIAEQYVKNVRTNVPMDMTQYILGGVDNYLDRYSVLGRTSESVAEGVGQYVALGAVGKILGAFGVGAKAISGVTSSIMGVSGAGSAEAEALKDGATQLEALKHGLNSGAADAVSEMLFGGFGKGANILGFNKGLLDADDLLAKTLTKDMKNQITKNIVEFGVKAGAEGLEEVIAGIAQAYSKHNTYMSEEEFLDILKDENLLEQFVVGALSSGVGQAPGLYRANSTKSDLITGYNQVEQSVVEKLVEKEIAKREEKGETLSSKEKSALEVEISQKMEKGYISVEDIEDAIGGKSYETFKAEKDKFFGGETYKSWQENKARTDELKTKIEELGKKTDATLMEQVQFQEMRNEFADRRAKQTEQKKALDAEADRIMGLRDQMRSEMMQTVRGSRLAESYAEMGRKRQKFQTDVSKYTNENARKTVQSILDSGLGDNSNQFHDTVEWLASISEQKGVTFDLTKTEWLKGTKHYKEGYVTNGFVNDKGDIMLNMDSDRVLNTTVGHEITHVLEKAGIYTELSKAVRDFAISKEGVEAYNKRMADIKEIYGNNQTKIDSELTADIIGEYLFTDSAFVNSLSTQNRNVFQKVYDEIKYLWKVATAGSKEKRELERVKKRFDQAWRENVKGKAETATETDAEVEEVQHSIVKDQKTIDWLEDQEYMTVYKAMSLHDGKLYPPMSSQEYVDEEYTTKSGETKTRRVRKLKNPSELGKWQQADERPDLIKNFKAPSKKYPDGYGTFDLLKSNGKTTGDVAYNPYEHTSNIVLNDQFAEAYQRPELVTVEYHIPKSELTSGYKAQYAKDPVGLTDWKTGIVATKLTKNKRDVYLTRWSKPVRIVPDSEVAQKYKELLDQEEGISVPWNVVTPSLRTELEKLGVPIDYSDVKAGSTIKNFQTEMAKNDELAQQILDTKSIQYSYSAIPSHKKSLEKNFDFENASLDLDTINQRYDKIIGIWEKLGGELDSKFLNDWNNKVERPFTIFKAQSGYKYNVELSSMCKKGVPLFEAIDTIVKKEVMKELDMKVMGKDEKEILYDILKQKHFEIPCAICYVEQARQREGVVIDAFLNGKAATDKKGADVKLGWNQVLDNIQKEMKANGSDYTFNFVSRDIATDKYIPTESNMDEQTYKAFAEAVKKLANEEITRYNKANGKNRPLLKDVTPEAVKECFKGGLPSNLKIFKVLLTEPSSRFKIQNDLLYSSMTTKNLTMAHNGLYSLFNSQGGVSGYKTKQAPTVYWGEILNKKWKPEDTRKEGGVRNQSNSDFQMYTLLDQAQMYMDFSAKGYYLQAYTKVLSELKLFGLSRGKINASLIPQVKVYRNADGTVDVEKTMENAGLDENGNPIYDDIEGINHTEAFMLLEDPEYSKNIGGICIGYSDNHIRKLLDDNRVQLIIGFHDKTNDPNKRYRGARYAKNYNGLNEATKLKADGTSETVHIGFNPFVKKAEKKFQFNKDTETFEGTVTYNGKSYTADDIPRLATDLYLEHCAKKGLTPAYDEFSGHQNYYKLLADFSLYDSEGHYAPHQKVAYNMPDSVPYLDADGNKQYMSSEDYIKIELQKELAVRDSLIDALADDSEDGIIPQFKAKVEKRKGKTQYSLTKDSDGNALTEAQAEFFKDSKIVDENGNLMPMYHGTKMGGFTVFDGGKDYWYFTNDPKYADTFEGRQDNGEYYPIVREGIEEGYYTPQKYSVYLDVKNPFVTDDIDIIEDALYWDKTLPEQLRKQGYDALMLEDMSQVIVLNQNQIKNMDNKNPTADPDIRYSMTKDSIGRELTEAQSEFFKDSKMRDDVGNLKVMYHGSTHGGFTVFDPNKSDDRRSLFFTDSFSNASSYSGVMDNTAFAPSKDDPDVNGEYAVNYGVYLDLKNPLIIEADGNNWDEIPYNTPEYKALKENIDHKWRVYQDMDNSADSQVLFDEIERLENEYYDSDPWSGDFMDTRGVSRWAKNHGYDGVIFRNLTDYGEELDVEIKPTTVAIAFDSNQVKSVRNTEPTADPDIRFSMTKKGESDDFGYVPSRDIGYHDELEDFAPIREDISKTETTTEESSATADNVGAVGDNIAPTDEEEKTPAQRRREKSKGYTEFWADLIGDTSTWVDMKTGLQYKTKTLRRILRNVVKDGRGNPDIKLADEIYDELETKYDHNEALLKKESKRLKEVFQKLNLNHAEDQYAQMLGELRHNPETTLSEDVVKEFLKKHKGRINEGKVETAIKESRKLYDDLIVRVNEVLREQGFQEIPYRQGYFPHFTNPKQNWLQKLLNWRPIDNEIPTSIAGLTEMFKPSRSWQSFNKRRMGDKTDYSLYQGLDTYIHGALDWIYHIEDLQKRRSLENYIRYTHSEEGVQQRIDEILNGDYDADEAQDMINAVLAESNNPLGGLVRELMNRTNTLANKKSSMDRSLEDMTNRKIYSTLTNLNNRITSNMVVGSFSSALTNFIPMVQSWHEVSPVYTVKGMGDFVRSAIKDDGVVAKSDFLTNRLMEEEKLFQTGWDKVSDKAGIMMQVVDNITSQTVWRSKYLQNLSEGMSEAQAIRNADQFAKNLMAGRSRGNAPTIFDAKNPLAKMFTAFQLEVANQYGYMFEDVPQDSKNMARLVKGYATAFLGAYAYNALYSTLVGRDAAFDPISIIEDLVKGLLDDEEEEEDVLMDFGKDILEEVPFVGGLMGGGRIPMSSAFPYSGYSNPIESMLSDLSEGKVSKEWLKPLYYLAMPVGGGQIKKTVEGLGMFSDDHPIAGSYTDSGNLRFPVEDTFGNKVQAAMFGQYASANARDYFDNNRSALKPNQIEEFMSSGMQIQDYWGYRDGLKGLDTIGEKADYIDSLDLPTSKKNMLINNLTDRKTPIDLTGYGKYEDFEEFDWATKNPEKYEFFKALGVSYKDYQNASEEKKKDYNWAYDYPQYVTLSKAVTDDVWEYREYYKDMVAFKADKDANGKSISGTKKAKVIDYINSLDIEYGAKMVLLKSQYESVDDYNEEIFEYIKAKKNLTLEEKMSILKTLGFRVYDDGKVEWD